MNAIVTEPSVAGDSSWTREWVSSVLSLVIVLFTLYLLYAMFNDTATDATQWEHRSAVLHVAIGLAATVVGYYYGRVPAEHAATVARQEATQNAQARQVAVDSEARLRTQLNELHADLTRGGLSSGGDIASRIARMTTPAA